MLKPFMPDRELPSLCAKGCFAGPASRARSNLGRAFLKGFQKAKPTRCACSQTSENRSQSPLPWHCVIVRGE